MLTTRRQKRLIKKKKAAKAAKTSAISAAGGMAIVTGIAAFMLFPQFGIPFAVAVGLSSLVIQLKTYWHDTQKSSTILFAKGMFFNLENNLIVREIMENERYKQIFINHLPPNADKKTIKKLIKKTVENYQDGVDDDIFDDFEQFGGLKAFEAIQHKLKTELLIKKPLCAIALFYSVLNGFSTVAITYTHASVISQQLILWIFGASFMATLPWFAPVITLLFALICGFAYSQMMFRMLSTTIEKNSFRKTFRTLKRLFVPEKPFRLMSRKERLLFITKCGLIGTLFAGILSLSILVTFFSGSTLLNQNILFLQSMVHLFTKLSYTTAVAINYISSIFIYVFFLPSAFLFSFENSWDTVHNVTQKIIYLIKHPADVKKAIIEKITMVKNDPKQWWKLPGLIIGTLIVTVALGLHVIGEGSKNSESLLSNNRVGLQLVDNISDFFQTINNYAASLLAISTALFTVISEGILEALEHMSFLQGGKQHGDSVTHYCAESSYRIMNKLFGNKPAYTTRTNGTKVHAIKYPNYFDVDIDVKPKKSVFQSNFVKKVLVFFKLQEAPPKAEAHEMQSLLMDSNTSSSLKRF